MIDLRNATKFFMNLHDEQDANRSTRKKSQWPTPPSKFGSIEEWSRAKHAKKQKHDRADSPIEKMPNFDKESDEFEVEGILYPCGEENPSESTWERVFPKKKSPPVHPPETPNIIDNILQIWEKKYPTKK